MLFVPSLPPKAKAALPYLAPVAFCAVRPDALPQWVPGIVVAALWLVAASTPNSRREFVAALVASVCGLYDGVCSVKRSKLRSIRTPKHALAATALITPLVVVTVVLLERQPVTETRCGITGVSWAVLDPKHFHDFNLKYFPVLNDTSKTIVCPHNQCHCVARECVINERALPDACSSDNFMFQAVNAYEEPPANKNISMVEELFRKVTPVCPSPSSDCPFQPFTATTYPWQIQSDGMDYYPFLEYNVGLYTEDLNTYIAVFMEDEISFQTGSWTDYEGTTYYSVFVALPSRRVLHSSITRRSLQR